MTARKARARARAKARAKAKARTGDSGFLASLGMTARKARARARAKARARVRAKAKAVTQIHLGNDKQNELGEVHGGDEHVD
jgi:hypothetical protein